MQVAIVQYVSECDVEETGVRCSYEQALVELRAVADEAPDRLKEFDLVAVRADGTLGQFVSWVV